MKKNILVTGAGALLGQGILRMLQISNFAKKVFTADPNPSSSGHWLGDYAITIPMANEVDYIERIKGIIKTYKIDLILIGTDVELEILSKNKEELYRDFKCKVIVASESVIKIANNKYLTAQFLEKNNFPFPISVMANDKDKLIEIECKVGFPLFAKPINGARSIGVKKIYNHEELMSLFDPKSDLVVQQYLPETDGEFTSGCMLVNGDCKAIVTLRRDLRDGNTFRTYRDSKTHIYDNQIVSIAKSLNAEGPVNFQFRVVEGKPIVFEINGRFSGTTPLRQFYGFNEVEAIVKNYLFKDKIEMPKLKNGIVLRTWSDIFIEEEELNKLKKEGVLDQPKGKFKNFSLNE